MYNLDFSAYPPDTILEYLRKSRSDDPCLTVEEVLDKHETILRDWAERRLSGTIPESNIFREVVSGETIADRPEMCRLLRLIESPKITAVLVIEVQRLSRGDLEDAGRLIKLLRYTNTVVITPDMTYDLNNEHDRDSFERELKRGNEYLEYTKKIMRRGRLASVSKGHYIGSVAPYGFDKVWAAEGKEKYPTLAINEKENSVKVLMYDMLIDQGFGCTTIANQLNKMGYRPRKAKLWETCSVRGVLTNPHNIGKVFWNRRKEILTVEDMEVIKSRPRQKYGDYLIFDGKHPAAIPEDRFWIAMDRLHENVPVKSNVKVRNPLSGLVYCRCGHPMTYRTYKKNGRERSAPRLLCTHQTYCQTASCTYSEIEDEVRRILASSISDFEIQLANNNTDKLQSQESIIKSLEDQLAILEQKEISQWEKYSEEAMPRHIFDKLNEKVKKEIEEVKQAILEAQDSLPTPMVYEERIHRFKDALDALNNPDTPAEIKNRLLKACIERITYSREKQERIKGTGPANRKGRLYSDSTIELDIKLRI